jgi:hypothetical protein
LSSSFPSSEFDSLDWGRKAYIVSSAMRSSIFLIPDLFTDPRLYNSTISLSYNSSGVLIPFNTSLTFTTASKMPFLVVVREVEMAFETLVNAPGTTRFGIVVSSENRRAEADLSLVITLDCDI